MPVGTGHGNGFNHIKTQGGALYLCSTRHGKKLQRTRFCGRMGCESLRHRHSETRCRDMLRCGRKTLPQRFSPGFTHSIYTVARSYRLSAKTGSFTDENIISVGPHHKPESAPAPKYCKSGSGKVKPKGFYHCVGWSETITVNHTLQRAPDRSCRKPVRRSG